LTRRLSNADVEQRRRARHAGAGTAASAARILSFVQHPFGAGPWRARILNNVQHASALGRSWPLAAVRS